MNKKRVLIWVIITFISLLLLASFILAIIYGPSFLNPKIEKYGILAIFVFSFLTEFLPQYLSPSFALVNGALFGFNPLSVILAAVIGCILGSVFGFGVGRYYGVHLTTELIGKKKFAKTERFMNFWGGKLVVFLGAVAPLPYFPMVFGSLKMSWRNFIIFGLIPRVIGLFVVSLIFLIL